MNEANTFRHNTEIDSQEEIADQSAVDTTTSPAQSPQNNNFEILQVGIVVLLVILVFVGGFWYFFTSYMPFSTTDSDTIDQDITSSSSPTTTQQPGSPAGNQGQLRDQEETPANSQSELNKQYTSSEAQFSFSYSAEATLEEMQDTSILVSKWGPTQRAGTELYDGYAVRLVVNQLDQSTLREQLEERIRNSADMEYTQIDSELRQVSVGGKTAYTYTASGLGTFTYYFFELPGTKQYLEVSIIAAGENAQEYRQEAMQVIESLQFSR